MIIDLNKIKTLIRDMKDLKAFIASEFERGGPSDPPYLSSVMVGFNQGGVYVMEALAMRYEQDRKLPNDRKFSWKLLVLCDEWGNKPVPGDTVYRKEQLPLQHEPGKPLTSEEINIEKMNGTYEKNWVRRIPYTIDEKGCITVEFEDASYFLTVFGVHGKSGAPMSIHKKEHSGEPLTTPRGDKLHCWYWRFKEQDKEMYAELPKITDKEIETRKKKRGREEPEGAAVNQ